MGNQIDGERGEYNGKWYGDLSANPEGRVVDEGHPCLAASLRTSQAAIYCSNQVTFSWQPTTCVRVELVR